MEPFGDQDDETLERLSRLQERTKYEETRFRQLTQLRYLKTRTNRSRHRRQHTVEGASQKVDALLSKQKDVPTLDHKLPDFKVRQLQAYHSRVPSRKMESPFCLLTNPDMPFEEFKKKFKFVGEEKKGEENKKEENKE